MNNQLEDILSKKDLLKNKEKEWDSFNNTLKTEDYKIFSKKNELDREHSDGNGSLGCVTVILSFIYFIIFSIIKDTSLGIPILVILGLIPGFLIWTIIYDIINKKKKEKEIKSLKINKNKTEVEINNISPEIKKLKEEISLLEESYSIPVKEFLHEMFDKNKNMEIDELEKPDDFMLLVQTNQQKIIEFDKSENKNYIKLFIQVHERIELKKNNINNIFEKILRYKGPYDKKTNHKSFIQIIKNEIHSYNVFLTNSIFMVSSLINDDRITFYKIYQIFDKLEIFNSNFENESLNQLKNINNNLIKVIDSIGQMNFSITSELQELNYITEKNTELIQESLNQINSSININTLINSINTYQNYKINKNTKRLN